MCCKGRWIEPGHSSSRWAIGEPLLTRHLLTLDLDETLVYATPEPRADLGSADFRVGEHHVNRRPYLDGFLNSAKTAFDLAVWSSASKPYVSELAERIFPTPTDLRFVWSCERCTRRFHPEKQDYYWVQDLKKVKRAGFALERVLMIDDSPEKLERNYGNHLRVTAFEGQSADTELRELKRFLVRLLAVVDVRPVEKRNWRQRARPTGA